MRHLFGETLLGVGHATARNRASSPGLAHGTRSPGAGADSPSGGVPGVEPRPGGPRRHEWVVRAGECQCDESLVPAAHRQSECPLCRSPVVHRLDEDGREGRYALAADALERSFLTPGQIQSVEAACPGCLDHLGGRMLLVREVEDSEDGPGYVDTVVKDGGCGDGPTVLSCVRCEKTLEASEVVDRRRPLRLVAA